MLAALFLIRVVMAESDAVRASWPPPEAVAVPGCRGIVPTAYACTPAASSEPHQPTYSDALDLPLTHSCLTPPRADCEAHNSIREKRQTQSVSSNKLTAGLNAFLRFLPYKIGSDTADL
jgi:hypothetical protein